MSQYDNFGDQHNAAMKEMLVNVLLSDVEPKTRQEAERIASESLDTESLKRFEQMLNFLKARAEEEEDSPSP